MPPIRSKFHVEARIVSHKVICVKGTDHEEAEQEFKDQVTAQLKELGYGDIDIEVTDVEPGR